MNLSVIGLGKLGACIASCLTMKGFKVIGVDVNKSFVESINQLKAPFYEPKLEEYLKKAKNRLLATADYQKAINETDISFLIVPTPSLSDGSFSDKYLKDALKPLSLALKESKKPYHLFVIVSTVSPGTLENSLIQFIERHSGRRVNEGFGICYSPTLIALGSVIYDFLHPDVIFIGESDKFAGQQLVDIYKKICENKPYIARMSIISAEITKISLNSFITMKISFANTLARICEKIPGADIDTITQALGADKRISPYYLKGGLSYGGPCFPRDNRAFSTFASKYKVDAKLAKSTGEVNNEVIKSLIQKVNKIISKKKNIKVAVLGLAYKPNTPVIEESAGIKIVTELLKNKHIKVTVYDPVAIDNIKKTLTEKVDYASSLRDCFQNNNLVIITAQSNEYKQISKESFSKKKLIIIDCWRILDVTKLGDKVRYIALGKK